MAFTDLNKVAKEYQKLKDYTFSEKTELIRMLTYGLENEFVERHIRG